MEQALAARAAHELTVFCVVARVEQIFGKDDTIEGKIIFITVFSFV